MTNQGTGAGSQGAKPVVEMGRRGFLAASASLVASAMMTKLVRPALAANQTPPNIVYIITDDQGWKDVGYHGSDIKTPNIDKLAAEGARLEQYYAQPM